MADKYVLCNEEDFTSFINAPIKQSSRIKVRISYVYSLFDPWNFLKSIVVYYQRCN